MTSRTFAHVMTRILNTPLLADPAKAHAFLAGLGPRLFSGEIAVQGFDASGVGDRLARASRLEERASILGDEMGERAQAGGRRLFSVREGIAVIEITGTLVHRGAWIGESSGTTTYEGIAAQIRAATADTSVRGIALEIDSYGGEVAGCFDLADLIRTARVQKPVWAFVAEAALSAAYALAAQATRIVLPRTGEVGSIGVLGIHADMSQALADQGLALTLIYSGAHKVDGNPYEALPDDVRADFQARADRSRALFVQTVGAGRGRRLTAQAALDTEARVYQGAEAVAAGLADDVSEPRAAFAAFVADLNRRAAAATPAALVARSKETPIMTGESQTAEPAEADTALPQTNQEQEAATESGAASPAPVALAPMITRQDAAALAEVAQTAARLGVTVDLADAITRGLSADTLRQTVLGELARRADTASVQPAAPAAAAKPKESPVVAAAKRAAAAATAKT